MVWTDWVPSLVQGDCLWTKCRLVDNIAASFPDVHIVCMKLASTFDGQLSPVSPWCGQTGCQVWCKEVARKKSEQELQDEEWEHIAEAPLQMCFSKNLGCVAPFLVVVVTD